MKSVEFAIKRGVVQGDITSPVYFIIALEAISWEHDKRTDKGVTFGQTIIHTLGYADDAALIDDGDEVGQQIATERVTAVTSMEQVCDAME